MAILFNNGATGTLKPPILNGITNINSPVGENLTISAGPIMSILADNLEIIGNDTIQITSNLINFSSSGDIGIVTPNTLEIDAPNINLNGISKYFYYTTAEILLITPVVGMQVFCSTINQMVFYQVSPITGLVLGWYNSTGTIKL